MMEDIKNNIQFIENNDWEMLQKQVNQCTGKLYVLMDVNSMEFCYPLLLQALPELKNSELLEIEAGEESKNLQIAAGIWETLSEQNAGRDSLFINLGGGVVCDLGGFVASTYKRGIPFIHLPTTLLAMVDAAIGGKTAIDFMDYKNQIGTFSRAEGIFIWPHFLKTLPKKELLAGHAESIKHALIADKSFWVELLNIPAEEIGKQDFIKRSMQIKERIIEQDPFEKAERKLLNFGHTIGHALESHFLSKRKAILHGDAVAAGMICETYISGKLSGLPQKSLSEIVNHINSLFPKIEFSEEDISPILHFLAQDKKNEGGKNRFVLLEEIGKAGYEWEVEKKLIEESLDFYINPK